MGVQMVGLHEGLEGVQDRGQDKGPDRGPDTGV